MSTFLCETCSVALNRGKYKNAKHMHIRHLKYPSNTQRASRGRIGLGYLTNCHIQLHIKRAVPPCHIILAPGQPVVRLILKRQLCCGVDSKIPICNFIDMT